MDEKLLGKCGFYCGACPTYMAVAVAVRKNTLRVIASPVIV